MPNLGFPEILALLVIALLVFGAKRLPEIGQSMGKGIREFKKSLADTQDAVMRDDSADRRMLDADRGLHDEAPSRTAGEPKRLSQ
ncbi:MAG: twin-arginine translocase TatA/TatE family subunit [Gemmatimonadetes bacterium]|nr:twin-arginine translocase TatA/TatE family subunit [Gemmatimonadota bacterium]MCB9505664.1 twin-arginine translocase TatA/TatE family subunit [Gemmatimonadales bacterium]MCB9517340.1 twin-arginine translocase TatA/TatE family subunit [Gemmatimonadales bacterium]HPF60422.1 twin-arginine translocase TatA/TatE family subunit [Gemmatimonadales bacterium]HRX19242.1 twin-arginine translocase TatA/TatE family subunit [Gemmatimonadales bacterium]